MTTFDAANSSGAGVMKSTHCSSPGGPSQWKKAAGTGAPRTRNRPEGRYWKKKPLQTPSAAPASQAADKAAQQPAAPSLAQCRMDDQERADHRPSNCAYRRDKETCVGASCCQNTPRAGDWL